MSKKKRYSAKAYRVEKTDPESASGKQGFAFEISLERDEAISLAAGILNRINDGKQKIRVIVKENGHTFVG